MATPLLAQIPNSKKNMTTLALKQQKSHHIIYQLKLKWENTNYESVIL